MTLGATVPDAGHAQIDGDFTVDALDASSTIAITTQVLREQEDVVSLLDTLANAAAMLIPACTDARLLQVGEQGQCRPVPGGRDGDGGVGTNRPHRAATQLDDRLRTAAVNAATRTRVSHAPELAGELPTVVGVPLLLRTERSGQRVVLTLSSQTGFSESDLAAAAVLGVHVASVYDGLQAEMRAAHLETALASSRTIGTSIGVLMNRFGLSQDDAFDVLKRLSQDQNRKLRDLAEDIVQGRL